MNRDEYRRVGGGSSLRGRRSHPHFPPRRSRPRAIARRRRPPRRGLRGRRRDSVPADGHRRRRAVSLRLVRITIGVFFSAFSASPRPPRDAFCPFLAFVNDLETWLSLMRRGAFAEAWKVSDASLRDRTGTNCWHLPRHEQWVWDGTPLNGKRILVRCYHGLGDTLQFIRYVPLARRIASHVTV